jgi:hypothetical protein
MKVRRRTCLAQELRRGVIAAVAGTGAMTLSSSLEMKIRGREPSMVPADAAAKVLGIRPRSERSKKWLGTAAHLASGLALGLLRPVIGAAGVREPAASAFYFWITWSPDLIAVPAMRLAPPPWRWGPAEIMISGAHHLMFTAGASLAYERSAASPG